MAESKAREWAEWWDAKDTVRPPGLGDEAFREMIERLEALERQVGALRGWQKNQLLVMKRLARLEEEMRGWLGSHEQQIFGSMSERLDRLEAQAESIAWRHLQTFRDETTARLGALERQVGATHTPTHGEGHPPSASVGDQPAAANEPPEGYVTIDDGTLCKRVVAQVMYDAWQRDHRAMERLRAEEWYLLTHYRINGKNRWRFAGKEAADPADAILGEEKELKLVDPPAALKESLRRLDEDDFPESSCFIGSDAPKREVPDDPQWADEYWAHQGDRTPEDG